MEFFSGRDKKMVIWTTVFWRLDQIAAKARNDLATRLRTQTGIQNQIDLEHRGGLYNIRLPRKRRLYSRG
jgi:hypothetical protein